MINGLLMASLRQWPFMLINIYSAINFLNCIWINDKPWQICMRHYYVHSEPSSVTFCTSVYKSDYMILNHLLLFFVLLSYDLCKDFHFISNAVWVEPCIYILFTAGLFTAISTKPLLLLFLFFPFILHPAHLSSLVSDAVGMGCRGCREVVKSFHQRPVNYGCSRGRGREEEGEPSLYLSWAGVTGVTGLSCMSGAPVFNHSGDTLLLFLPSPHCLPPDQPTNLPASCPTGCWVS